MIKVRQATLLDLLLLAPLAERYASEAQGHSNFPLDLEFCLQNAAATIMNDSGCLLVAFDGNTAVGLLWGHASPLPWSKAQLAFDSILYVVPEKRKSFVGYRLMQAWEQWAKSRGAVEAQISIASGIHEEATLSFYKRLGYKYIGQQLRKEI